MRIIPIGILESAARLRDLLGGIAKRVSRCLVEIRGWCWRHKPTIGGIGLAVAIGGLVFLGIETHLLVQEHRATFRPSLCVENITTQDANGSSLDILISVKNYGQVPATPAHLQVIIGGADIEYHEKTGTYTFIYTSNGTYVVPLLRGNYPPDLIFFPGKEELITVPSVHKPTYEDTVSATKVMYVALQYSSGRDQYYYIAQAALQNGTWKVTEHRGN